MKANRARSKKKVSRKLFVLFSSDFSLLHVGFSRIPESRERGRERKIIIILILFFSGESLRRKRSLTNWILKLGDNKTPDVISRRLHSLLYARRSSTKTMTAPVVITGIVVLSVVITVCSVILLVSSVTCCRDRRICPLGLLFMAHRPRCSADEEFEGKTKQSSRIDWFRQLYSYRCLTNVPKRLVLAARAERRKIVVHERIKFWIVIHRRILRNSFDRMRRHSSPSASLKRDSFRWSFISMLWEEYEMRNVDQA